MDAGFEKLFSLQNFKRKIHANVINPMETYNCAMDEQK